MKWRSLLAIICFCSCLVACKKGVDDPAFSLQSRTARLSGKWRLAEGLLTAKIVDINNQSASYTYSLSGKEYSVGILGKGTAVGPFEITLTIDDDNSFLCNQLIDQDLESIAGNWQFMKKQGEYKNKERVLFKTANNSATSNNLLSFSKAGLSFVYAITELRKDRIVLECTNELLYADVTANINDKVYVTAKYVFVP